MIPASLLPLALVVGFGILMGAMPALVRQAALIGVPAVAFALAQALGAGGILLAACLAGKTPPPLERRHLRYYAVAGLSGIALPNAALYLAVPHLGVGLSGLTYCFPPLFTLAIALLLGMERPCPWRIMGIATGFAATVLIALPGPGGIDADPGWLMLAMVSPASLAFGNIYRSRAWPKGAPALALAAGMLLSGALWLVPLLVLSGEPMAGLSSWTGASILAAAAIMTALAYAMFLTLQRVAGPVYLSQVGYILTGTGLCLGVLMLGESYPPRVWVGAALVVAGLLLASLPTLMRGGRGAKPAKGVD